MAEKPSELNKLDAVSVAGADSNPLVETHTGDNRRTESDRQELSAYSDGDVEKGTEDIKAQIEETRSNLGVTIDAIQDKLSFSNISEQVSEQVNNAIETAKDNVYEATIGKAVNFMKNTGNEIS